MSTEALILMLVVQGTVTVVTAYFFIKVLKTPPKQHDEED
jgi:hypothetical protein